MSEKKMSLKERRIVEWIADNEEIWYKICGIKPLSAEDFKNILSILEKENFMELKYVITTSFLERVNKCNDMNSEVKEPN